MLLEVFEKEDAAFWLFNRPLDSRWKKKKHEM
jgi:hypothetical protein